MQRFRFRRATGRRNMPAKPEPGGKHMTIQSRTVPYQHRGAQLNGFLAWDGSAAGKRPVVLIAHAWHGLTDQEKEIARYVAGLGWAAFAIDLYGKVGHSRDENRALMTPFLEDRALLQDRMKTALAIARAQPECAHDAAVIGFCFGGLCALDLGRTGVDLAGVVSFHGLFGAPEVGKAEHIPAKILLLHGWDDPMVKPESVIAIAQELSAAGADWRLHAYGGTMHAFTNAEANDPDFGTVYNERAARLAWDAMESFLKEVF
jgi:dienelactone hydrolase